MPMNNLLEPWKTSDLKLLDPPDASLPTQDLIALYARQDDYNLQFRLDFLDTDRFDEINIFLVIDYCVGGTQSLPFPGKAEIEWDHLIKIPGHGAITMRSANGLEQSGSAIFVIRDPINQAILVNINRQALMPDWGKIGIVRSPGFQVFITQSESVLIDSGGTRGLIVDQSEPFRLSDSSPAPAQVLFAFWDTYLAYTPATALRRWDGAHTGPYGGRHGLYNLLRTAQASRIPLFLMDLNASDTLSSLDYAGFVEGIRSMQETGLLTLPVGSPDPNNGPASFDCQGLDRIRNWQSQVSERFSLAPEKFIYMPSESVLGCLDDGVIFSQREFDRKIRVGDTFDQEINLLHMPERWGQKLVFPINSATVISKNGEANIPNPADRNGLTLAWRKILIEAAIQSGSTLESTTNSYLNLGGSLPESAWGDPQSARAAFKWIKNHPWIKVLSEEDLLVMKGKDRRPSTSTEAPTNTTKSDINIQDLSFELQNAPNNDLGEAAWQNFYSLYAPIFPPSNELSDLRLTYSKDAWSLLEAAKWGEKPFNSKECTRDIDHDGTPECVFTTSEVYAQFEIDDGSLSWLFISTRDNDTDQNKLHEVIGPSSQIISGLSNPTTWFSNAGALSDPDVISGAFSDPDQGYSVDQISDGLIFFKNNGSKKIFHFLPGELRVEIIADDSENIPSTYQIPLLLDPWRRFYPGWAELYTGLQTANTFQWMLADGPTIHISTTSRLQGSDFQASQSLFSKPEDPNQDLPSGHFLPFPLVLIQIKTAEKLTVCVQYH